MEGQSRRVRGSAVGGARGGASAFSIPAGGETEDLIGSGALSAIAIAEVACTSDGRVNWETNTGLYHYATDNDPLATQGGDRDMYWRFSRPLSAFYGVTGFYTDVTISRVSAGEPDFLWTWSLIKTDFTIADGEAIGALSLETLETWNWDFTADFDSHELQVGTGNWAQAVKTSGPYYGLRVQLAAGSNEIRADVNGCLVMAFGR